MLDYLTANWGEHAWHYAHACWLEYKPKRWLYVWNLMRYGEKKPKMSQKELKVLKKQNKLYWARLEKHFGISNEEFADRKEDIK